MNDEDTWEQVDDFLVGILQGSDQILDACLAANARADLPPIDVSPLQGKLLSLLAQMAGARNILEIGALGGYSTICLARALPADGRLTRLELDPHHAEVALSNVTRAGLAGKVELIQGPAAESLARLVAENRAPFDFIFIDADKAGYPVYLDWALKLARIGTVIIGDNVVRQGKIIQTDSDDTNVRGARRFIEMAGTNPRLSATVMQTVGKKGYDGMLVARVVS